MKTWQKYAVTAAISILAVWAWNNVVVARFAPSLPTA